MLAIFKRHNFKTEQWDSAQVVDIIKRDAPAREATKSLLDYFIYGDEREKIIHETVLRYVLRYNIPESQYPYVRYVGIVNQEKISANYILPETIVVVNKNDDEYTYPQITDGQEQYRMFFRFQNESEMTFIKMSDNMEIGYLRTLFGLLPTEINMLHRDEPDYPKTNALHFACGFRAGREGCYRNTMGMFIRNTTTNEDFFIGALEFRSTVVGEDERYRTLLGNFGIPDPKTYPNIFREQDPDE